MGLHLIATIGHIGKTIKHVADGEDKQAAAEVVKTVASIIPGGGIVAGMAMGAVIDGAIVEGHTGPAVHMAHNAWDNRDDIADAIDAAGNCDGALEASDFFDVAKDFLLS